MSEADYNRWLEASGANSADGRNTRIQSIRRIERCLGDLGFAHRDLDQAWAADKFAALLSRLDQMKADSRAGGEDYRKLLPKSEKPLPRLRNWTSWLRQYGRFLSGEPAPPASDADRIRQHVLHEYIEPAREAERDSVDVSVREVNTALGLNQAWPNICQTLTGAKFLDMADVGPPARTGAKVSSATIYHFNLGGETALDVTALASMKARFLETFPNFTGFDVASDYSGREDNYKRALISRAAEIIAGDSKDDESTGTALLDLLDGRGGLESNLLGWRMTSGLRGVRAKHPGAIEQAAAELVRAPDIIAGVETFLETCWPLLSEGQESSMPYGDSRTIPTMLAALARPSDVVGLRYQPFHTVGTALLHRSLFANARLSSTELADAIGMSRAILAAMRDWGWAPRDLWDVQGFIWTVTQDDTALLKRFDVDPGFKAARSTWSRQQSTAFCRIARAVHDAGLDWWFVRIEPYDLRFGRKSAGRAKAEGVLGYVNQNPASIYFNRRPNIIDDGVPDRLSLAQTELFETVLAAKREKIAGWLTPIPPRRGRWPDEGSPEQRDELVFKDGQAMVQPDPTNLILFGPPGTGKTFNTAREAVMLCDGDAPFPDDATGRAALMVRYDELCRKQRIGFVTFHQNFSYEDFVEGLRPVASSAEGEAESGSGFSLQAHDGIFKQIADLAASNRGKAIGDRPVIDRSKSIFKMSLGRSREVEDDVIYQDAISGGYIVLGWGGEIDWSDPQFDEFAAIKQRWREQEPDATGNNPNIAQTYTFRANMQVGSLVVISDGNRKFRAIGEITGPYEFVPASTREYHHRRAVNWLWHSEESLPSARIYSKDLSQVSAYQLNSRLVDWDALEQVVASGGEAAATTGTPEPYVLIIDEINRANISNVFGELITLIEPDKRLEKPNAVKVTLPYSKAEFGVPANLHIIGTMNTADRSIALLDTALRRRFVFREMEPRPDLLQQIGDIDLPAMLRSINDRIEYLLDREHRIGHAYFIHCKSPVDVDQVMRDRVIPLLQEYFFEDWSRIRAVVGSGFIGSRKLPAPPGFNGEDRQSWFVRPAFTPNAYTILVSGKGTDDSGIEAPIEE